MSKQQNLMSDYLRLCPEAHREATRGLVRIIAQALAQADALGCERAAIYLASARDVTEAAAERHKLPERVN